MITFKTEREIAKMQRAGEVISRIFEFCSQLVLPGITTLEIDRAVEAFIRRNGAAPALKGLYGYPASICASVNEEVLHGLPAERALVEGDVLTIDVGVAWDGYHADAARTVVVGRGTDEARRLIATTAEALDRAIEVCRPGRWLSEVAHAIERVAARDGYGIVDGYVGHGIGTKLHEEPEVPNRVTPRLRRQDLLLESGMALAIEPVFRVGSGATRLLGNGWTVVTGDARLSAHFEDTVVIMDDGPRVLTRVGHALACAG